MEIKQCICLEITKGEHTFTFMMPAGSTWGSAMDASFEVIQQIGKFAAEAIEKAKPSVVDPAPAEVTPELV
jgi:hypothetical protein